MVEKRDTTLHLSVTDMQAEAPVADLSVLASLYPETFSVVLETQGQTFRFNCVRKPIYEVMPGLDAREDAEERTYAAAHEEFLSVCAACITSPVVTVDSLRALPASVVINVGTAIMSEISPTVADDEALPVSGSVASAAPQGAGASESSA